MRVESANLCILDECIDIPCIISMMNASIFGERERANRDRRCSTGQARLLVAVPAPRLACDVGVANARDETRSQKVRSHNCSVVS